MASLAARSLPIELNLKACKAAFVSLCFLRSTHEGPVPMPVWIDFLRRVVDVCAFHLRRDVAEQTDPLVHDWNRFSRSNRHSERPGPSHPFLGVV